MSLSLANFPIEVLDNVVRRLPLTDTRNLRLSERSLAEKVAQTHFRSFYQSRHVEITRSGLTGLEDMLRHGGLCSELRDLTLVGLAYDTQVRVKLRPNEMARVGRKLFEPAGNAAEIEKRKREQEEFFSFEVAAKLLAGFRCIRQHGAIRKLRSLSLEVRIVNTDIDSRTMPLSAVTWSLAWQAADTTFHTVMRAVFESGLVVEHLDVFNHRTLQRCSLASDVLNHLDFQDPRVVSSMSSLRSLSLSFSNKLQLYESGAVYDERAIRAQLTRLRSETAVESNVTGLAQFLQLIDQLESLALHQYVISVFTLTYDDRRIQAPIQQVIATNVLPSKLRRLELRGLRIDESDLLASIKGKNLQDLSLYHIFLLSGSFRSIFDYCTSPGAPIVRLHCKGLVEGGGYLGYFDRDCKNQFVFTREDPLLSFSRDETNIKVRVDYELVPYFLGSPQEAACRRRCWEEYGPQDGD